jgi:hypothetical protein
VGLTGTLTAFGIGATDYGQISADALDDEVLASTPRMPDAADIAAILAAAQELPAVSPCPGMIRLTLDEEAAWIPRTLVPCPVPARSARRAAPT